MALSKTKVTLTYEAHDDEELEPLIKALDNAIDTIGSLTLRTYYLGDESAEKIARFIAKSSAIEEVDLVFNRITVTGMKAIAGAVAVNASVRVLNLWGNAILPSEHREMDLYMAKAIQTGVARPQNSVWRLYSDREDVNDYGRLSKVLLDDLEYK